MQTFNYEYDDIALDSSVPSINAPQPGLADLACHLPLTEDIRVPRKKAAPLIISRKAPKLRVTSTVPSAPESLPLPRPPRPTKRAAPPRSPSPDRPRPPKLTPAPIETTAAFSGLDSKARIARAVAPNVSVFVPDAPSAGPETMPQLVPDASADEDLGGGASTRNTDEFWGGSLELPGADDYEPATQEHQYER